MVHRLYIQVVGMLACYVLQRIEQVYRSYSGFVRTLCLVGEPVWERLSGIHTRLGARAFNLSLRTKHQIGDMVPLS